MKPVTIHFMTTKPLNTSRRTLMNPLVGHSSVAPFLLFLTILVIGIGPRISLGFVDAEIRIQDVLLGPIILYLLLSRKPPAKLPVQRLLGKVLPVFLWASFITVTLSVLVFPEVSLLRRVTYYGRTLEMLVLAVVIAALYLRSGEKALKTVLSAITLGVILNILWVGYQVASNTRETLFGQEFSSQVGSYGPQLLGEPSPFGVGQYWAFVGAVAVARIKSKYRPFLSVLMLASAFTGAWLAQSRISVGSILVIAGIALVLGKSKRQGVNILGTLIGLLASFIGALQVIPTLDGRVSPDSIVGSFFFRMDNIWGPFMDMALQSPLIGVGPGGLLGSTYLSEAHNIFIRAMLDFGFIVGLVFIFLFLRSMVRGFKLARGEGIDPATRVAGYIGAYCVLSTLVSGQVQDALTSVMSSHLTMVAIGILAAQRAIYLDKKEQDEQSKEASKLSEAAPK